MKIGRVAPIVAGSVLIVVGGLWTLFFVLLLLYIRGEGDADAYVFVVVMIGLGLAWVMLGAVAGSPSERQLCRRSALTPEMILPLAMAARRRWTSGLGWEASGHGATVIA